MNAHNVNRWLALVANLAVVVSMASLVLQLNQNSRMMKTQTRNAITESILNFQYNASSSGMVELAIKGNAEPGAMNSLELQKLMQYYVSNLRLWENIHYQYRNGVFDKAEFNAERNSWRALGERLLLLRAVYCNLKQRGSLSPGFVGEMDKLAYGAAGNCELDFDAALPEAANGQP